jgi:Fe-S cluster assembly protein SufD
MTTQNDIPLYDEVVKGFDQLTQSIAKSESADLRKTRLHAFENFRESGFPSIRNEDWKYTNLTRFLKDEYALALPGTVIDPTAIAKVSKLADTARIADFDCYTIVLVNGVWNKQLGSDLPKGFEILPVAEAKQDPALAESFGQSGKDRFFAALNTALFSDGLFIRVKAGALPDKPLHIIHAYIAGTNLMVQPRHLWVADEHAEANIVESIVAENTNAHIWVNSRTEIILHRDAKLDHAVIQSAPAGIRLVNRTTVRQKKQSLYNNYTFTLPGADLVRNDLQAKLEEDHTETHLYGLYLAAGQQLVDNHTLVDHQKPSCFSNELYKGVLLEQSTGVFNGKVYVHQDAQKTNAFQQNNNLVIGKKATIDSKPELEIFADDVKCSHGSTVGQFSEDALFYLRARGIGEAAARALLINAFAFDVTEKIKHAAVETHVNRLISIHIPVTQ